VRGKFSLAACLTIGLCGCATATTQFGVSPLTNSVTPSPTGTPNSVVTLGNFEFVSVQGAGQIFTYNVGVESQTQTGAPYMTPCADPSGMIATNIGGNNVLAVVCYDTGALVTLSIGGNGLLTALGSLTGLTTPYPGIALSGTDVLVPELGQPLVTNGSVVKVSLGNPAMPVITGTVTLASPAPGEFANPGYLAMAGANILVAAGSESAPQATSSTIQVVNEATMTLVGTPFVVAHSPQQIAVQQNVAFVTLYDEEQVESIDISNPASLKMLGTVTQSAAGQSCHPEPIVLNGSLAYVGCFVEGEIEEFNILDPTHMQAVGVIAEVPSPQRLAFSGSSLLATSAVSGGQVFEIQ
jgi:hypothetical protein